MAARTYRWWPSVQPTVLEVADPAGFARHVVFVAVVTAAMCIPPVVRATGLAVSAVIAINTVHLVWTLVVMVALRKSVVATPARFHFTFGGSIAINTFICVAFPALGADPETPLWMLPVMYACFTGGIQELDASIGVLAAHVVMPLLAIPFMLLRGSDPGWSIAAPALCSAASAVGYNHLAQLGAHWRESRRARDEVLAELRARLEEEDRARLARELHDSVGSSLAVVGLFGDLIDLHLDNPDELRSITAMVRDASREGGAELEALLGGIVPASASLDVVAAALIETANRAAMSSRSTIDVNVLQGGATEITGPVRLALLRVFQESLHNALQHGAARHVGISLTADASETTITISDDGIGFVPSATGTGSGLSGMRARVAELGGDFTLTTSPAGGARIVVTLPVSAGSA